MKNHYFKNNKKECVVTNYIEEDDDIFDGCGVEVTLNNPDDFLKIKETLTRMGIASHKTKTLFQSCHVLHKRGRYVIIHFLELFALDGKKTTFGDQDRSRRNIIVNLLEQWGLLKILPEEKERIEEDPKVRCSIKILPFEQKSEWILTEKYRVGSKQQPDNNQHQ